ncbi:DNA-directed RNA polymerase subunit beta [Caldibacillus lycopersici]|uniref:DNA-directed RNA polymerase subunit beta n=1 Tax=Perspicuibacillus lycopersici TaxID=1325689 RepID=A0AAE3IRS3_9BACI|nr:DNA-directed RNA polymerase subunit beta [Perspicuibacillus lycopersici]MCU9613276.1 DNA-directed RNA polymerase subunit beta [Perspicuibacillus lycopersici]
MENTELKIQSREDLKKLKEVSAVKKGKKVDDESREERKSKPKKLRVRLIPIWLRVVIVLVLIIVFFIIGSMIGYGIIGDGNPMDVLKKGTWTHIIDIVNEGTEPNK